MLATTLAATPISCKIRVTRPPPKAPAVCRGQSDQFADVFYDRKLKARKGKQPHRHRIPGHYAATEQRHGVRMAGGACADVGGRRRDPADRPISFRQGLPIGKPWLRP